MPQPNKDTQLQISSVVESSTEDSLNRIAAQAARLSKFSYKDLINHPVSKLALEVINNPENYGIPAHEPITQKHIQTIFSQYIKATTLGCRLQDLQAESILERNKTKGYFLSDKGKDLMQSAYGKNASRFALHTKAQIEKNKLLNSKGPSIDKTALVLPTELQNDRL